MKQAVDVWIPSDDREPIGGEGPKARPATAQADVRQSGSMLQKLIDEEILGFRVNLWYFGRTLGLIAWTKKEACSFRPHVVSDIEIPRQRSVMGKESRIAGDEQVATKAFSVGTEQIRGQDTPPTRLWHRRRCQHQLLQMKFGHRAQPIPGRSGIHRRSR